MSDENFGSWVRKQVIRDLFYTDFIRELIQNDELKDSMKSYNDFHNFYREQEENTKQIESLNEALSHFVKFKEDEAFIDKAEFQEIYRTALNARQVVRFLLAKVNNTLTIKNPDDVNIYDSLDSISRELESLVSLIGDVSFDHIKNFGESDLHQMRSKFDSQNLPGGNVEFELLEIVRDEFRKEKHRNRKHESRKA
ncbi:hypothetical protein [Leptospira bouyouniensis]|uniref:Uncharacterized protein n=1 Tax=Leptospira bouyouniensis TaxID=2484911 RepID=A0ABY2LCL2_9LEPT|nr:hypothetical protein [Leptospira bouyouniensis]TGK53241.1 hypothetical protein EHQ10_05730 [Leptospira bouyouniensis]